MKAVQLRIFIRTQLWVGKRYFGVGKASVWEVGVMVGKGLSQEAKEVAGKRLKEH